MLRLSCPRRTSLAALIAALTACAMCASAAEPNLRVVNPRGLQIGAKTTIVIDGENLGPTARLLLPADSAKQELLPGATAARATFEVTLTGAVSPGWHNLRVVTEGGVSGPALVEIQPLPHAMLKPILDAIPAVVDGVASGSAITETRFTGRAGQTVCLEVVAQRLGSKLRPVVHLYDERRLQLAWSWPTPTLGGDTRLNATLPADGAYIIALHDAEYAAPAASFFRLKIGQWAFVDQVFPPVVQRNQSTSVEIIGFPATSKAEVSAAGLESWKSIDWPKSAESSGPRPFVLVSDTPEVLEQTAGQIQDLPAAPVAVSGKLAAPGEEDRFRIAVTPGSKLRLEVFAERYGSPLDAALLVRGEKGEQIARAEDAPGTLDPLLEYTVPEKVTSLVVGVLDSQARGGPRSVYRLSIEPQGAGSGPGDFRLTTPVSRMCLPTNGRMVVPVQIERRGYLGAVNLTCEGLPSSIRLDGQIIPSGADGTLLTLANSEADFAPGLLNFFGTASEGGFARPVFVADHPLSRLQPWLATELAIAPTAATQFAVDWKNPASDTKLFLAGKLPLAVKLTRPAENTAVRLSLLTSQIQPLFNNRPDPLRTLRAEKAVELGAKVEEGELSVLIPADLVGPAQDVTLQAELLTADKKTVLATSYAPVLRLPVESPLAVKLDGETRLAVVSDPKMATTIRLAGKVQRQSGFDRDVTVALTGLPATFRAASPVLKADVSDFEFTIIVPANQAAGEITGVKLTASGAPAAPQPAVRVRGNEIDLTIDVQTPAAKK